MRLPRLRLPDRLIGKRPSGDAGLLWDQLDTMHRALATWQAELDREVVTRLHPSPIRYADCSAKIGEITMVDATDGAIVVQLPPATQATAGATLMIEPTGTVTVKASPPDTIDGAASVSLLSTLHITSDGAGRWLLTDAGAV